MSMLIQRAVLQFLISNKFSFHPFNRLENLAQTSRAIGMESLAERLTGKAQNNNFPCYTIFVPLQYLLSNIPFVSNKPPTDPGP